MKKEIIICVIVIIIVITLNVFSEKFTNKIMDDIITNLKNVREALLTENEEQMRENIEKVNNEWEENKSKLSIYIEHDELEKIEMYMVELNTHIETKEYNMAIESLDVGVFIIEHTKDKYKLSLKNIF